MKRDNTKYRFIVTMLIVIFAFAMVLIFSAQFAQGQELIRINPYAGLNSAFSRDLVKENQVIRLLNFWYHTPGDLEKRPGYSLFNHDHGAIDTYNVAGIYAATVKGAQHILVVTGDASVGDSERVGRLAIAEESRNDYDITTMRNLPPGNLYDWTTLKDTTFGVSGGAPMFNYTVDEGGKWTEPTPPGAPGATPIGDIGSGELFGVFQYAYGFFQRRMGPPSKPIRLQGQRTKLFGITPSIKKAAAARPRVVFRREVRINGDDTTRGTWNEADTILAVDSLVTFWIDSINDISGNDTAGVLTGGDVGGAYEIWSKTAAANDMTGEYPPGIPVWLFMDSCYDDPPTECAAGGDGLQDGVYAYGVSWFNNEGDTMPIMTIGLIDNTFDPDVFKHACSLKTFPTLPANVRMDSIILWRSDVDSAGGDNVFAPTDTTFFQIAKGAIGNFTVYQDKARDIPDSSLKYLGGNMFGFRHADSIPPLGANLFYKIPVPSQIEEHQDQLWLLSYEDQNSIQMSEVRILDSFPAGNSIVFPGAGGDSLTAIFAIGRFMVAAQSRSLYIVTGVDIFDFFKIKSESPIGVKAPQSVAVYQNTAFFVSETDIYAFSPPNSLKRISDEIHDLLDNISDAKKELAVGIVTDEGRYLLSINDTILVYDTRTASWSGQWSFSASSWTYANFDGNRELLFGSTTGDSLYVFNTGDTAIKDAGVMDTAIVRLPYIGPSGRILQITEVWLDRGGEGDSLLLRFFDESNTLVDSVWVGSGSLVQLIHPGAKVLGQALSLEIDDRGKNDSLVIRGIQLKPRNAGRPVGQ